MAKVRAEADQGLPLSQVSGGTSSFSFATGSPTNGPRIDLTLTFLAGATTSAAPSAVAPLGSTWNGHPTTHRCWSWPTRRSIAIPRAPPPPTPSFEVLPFSRSLQSSPFISSVFFSPFRENYPKTKKESNQKNSIAREEIKKKKFNLSKNLFYFSWDF